MKNTTLTLTTLFFSAVLGLAAPSTSLAAARCVNPAGAIVAYAQSAAACPAGSQFKGDVETAAAPSAAEQAQSKQLASKDKSTADAMERKRIADEKAQGKALLALQKRDNAKGKNCQKAELALARAQDHFDNAAGAKPKTKKSSAKSGQQTHTSERPDDAKQSKAQKKAKTKLEAAQDRRAIACS